MTKHLINGLHALYFLFSTDKFNEHEYFLMEKNSITIPPIDYSQIDLKFIPSQSLELLVYSRILYSRNKHLV